MVISSDPFSVLRSAAFVHIDGKLASAKLPNKAAILLINASRIVSRAAAKTDTP